MLHLTGVGDAEPGGHSCDEPELHGVQVSTDQAAPLVQGLLQAPPSRRHRPGALQNPLNIGDLGAHERIAGNTHESDGNVTCASSSLPLHFLSWQPFRRLLRLLAYGF